MPVTNPAHISTDKIVTITFQDGHKETVYVHDNRPQAQELYVEWGEAAYAAIPYSEIKSASVWVNVQSIGGR